MGAEGGSRTGRTSLDTTRRLVSLREPLTPYVSGAPSVSDLWRRRSGVRSLTSLGSALELTPST